MKYLEENVSVTILAGVMLSVLLLLNKDIKTCRGLGFFFNILNMIIFFSVVPECHSSARLD